MNLKKAIRVNPQDNLATVLDDLVAGDRVQVMEKDGEVFVIEVLEAIPFGHKFALVDIPEGKDVIKYGESIGVATDDIVKGHYIHTHNLASQRGR